MALGAITVIIIGTFLLYNSFEARFNSAPFSKDLKLFRNTKHFNISVFGTALAEYDILWTARLVEPFYEKTSAQFGNPSGKTWIVLYIADDFTDYYSSTGEGVLLPAKRVQGRDMRFILIKTAHVLIGSDTWPWHRNHIASEGLAAYCADTYLKTPFTVDPAFEKKASLTSLDRKRYFVWRRTEAEQEYIYAKAGAFMGYLISTYGQKKIQALIDEKGQGYEQIYGKSLKDLEVEWLASR